LLVSGSFFPLAMRESSRSTRKMMSIGGPSKATRADGQTDYRTLRAWVRAGPHSVPADDREVVVTPPFPVKCSLGDQVTDPRLTAERGGGCRTVLTLT